MLLIKNYHQSQKHHLAVCVSQSKPFIIPRLLPHFAGSSSRAHWETLVIANHRSIA